ncbi:hypothetical protein TNCV_1313561, partial [Trichonephila clavipes]
MLPVPEKLFRMVHEEGLIGSSYEKSKMWKKKYGRWRRAGKK